MIQLLVVLGGGIADLCGGAGGSGDVAEDELASGSAAHVREQGVGIIAFGEVAGGAGVDGAIDQVGLDVAAEDEHGDIGAVSADLLQGIERTWAGHIDIQQDDVGLKPLDVLEEV